MKPKPARAAARPPTHIEAQILTRAVAKANASVAGQRRAATPSAKQRRPKANTRLNKTGLVLYIDPGLNKLLKQTALDLDTSAHALGLLGLRLLVDKMGLDVPPEMLPLDVELAEHARAKMRGLPRYPS